MITKEQSDKLFDKITCNECREMTKERFYQAIKELEIPIKKEPYEPYFGWCDVKGCKNEGANGGGCWMNTGYWTVCSKHSQSYRNGDQQPEMKKKAINREKHRDPNTGILKSNQKH